MDVAAHNALLREVSAQVIDRNDPRYPPLLKAIPDPPAQLYVRGDPLLLHQPQLGVVGARRASPAALRLAETIAGLLSASGLHICSGLALGVDAAAHRGALAKGGTTIGVMATGIEQVYPRRNRALGESMLTQGCLVSEFPPGTPPRPQNFPQRNRIISGLSLGVLVIEAALPSGSLITAASAARQGREVFALPWSLLHEGGRGCLQLIRDGAQMVVDADDILQHLGPLHALQQDWCSALEIGDGDSEDRNKRCENDKSNDNNYDDKSGNNLCKKASGRNDTPDLLHSVGFEATSLDALVRSSALPVATVLQQLSQLEMAGQVTQVPGGYIRC